jgi:hypothetical protein
MKHETNCNLLFSSPRPLEESELATMPRLTLNFFDEAILQLRKSVNEDQQTNQSGLPSHHQDSSQENQHRKERVPIKPEVSEEAVQRYKRAQEVLQNQIASLKQRNEKLNQENKALAEANENRHSCQMDRVLGELQINMSKISEQRCHIDALRLELSERKSRSVDQQKEIDELEAKVVYLIDSLESSRQDCQTEMQKVVETQDELIICQNAVSDYKRQIVILTGQVEFQLDQRKNEIIDSQKEKSILKQTFEYEISALKKQLETKDKEKIEASAKIEKQKETIQNLSKGLMKIQNEEIPSLLAMFETKKNEVQALNSELEIRKTENEVLTTEMKSLQVRLNSEEMLRSEQITQHSEEIQLTKAKFQQEINNLHDEMGKLRYLNEFNESEIDQQRTGLKKQILESETKVNANQKELKLLNKKLNFAKTQLNIKVKEINILKKQSEAKDLELSRQKRELTNLG